MGNIDGFKGDNNQRAPDLYPPSNSTSNDGDKIGEVNEEKEDKQLLGKKRKSTSLNTEGPNHQNDLCPEIDSEQLRQSNIHSLLENLENLEYLLMRINLEIVNEFFKELEEMAFCEASTEASSDSDEKEEDGSNNEDQN